MTGPEWAWVAGAFIAAMAAVIGFAVLEEWWSERDRRQDREPPSQLDEWDRPRTTTDDGTWLP